MKKFWSKNKKNVWFWLTIIIALLFIRLGFESSSYMDKNTAQTKQIKKLKKQNKALTALVNGIAGADLTDQVDYSDDDSGDEDADSHTFALGEPVEFESGEEITVNSITDGGVLYEGAPDEYPVTANVTIKNTGNNPIDFNAQNFDIYDNDGSIGSFNSNTYEADIPDSIAAGKQAKINIIFGVKAKGSYSITFGDVTWEQ